MEAKGTQSPETIKMVERALDVLDLLQVRHQRLGVNEIAKYCGLNPSTAFRILKTLEKSGWVFQLSDGRYITGEKISFVTEKDNLYLALSDVAHFVMEEYTAKYNQPLNLLVRHGFRCTIIEQSLTDSIVNYVPPLYSDLPIYACSGGKLLLSELPINLVEQIISSSEMRPLTPYTITEPDKLWKVLREAAVNGYACDHKESSPNGSCIAVPVRNHDGTIIAALSFSGFIGLDTPEPLLDYLPALREASEKISQSLFRCWNR